MTVSISFAKIAVGAALLCVFALGAAALTNAQSYYYMPSNSIPPVYDGYDAYDSYGYDSYVYGSGYGYPGYPTYPTYPSYPLEVSCRPSVSQARTGQTITWSAYPSGGTGSYSYSWTGTDNLRGEGQSFYTSYRTDGRKRASVTVRSGNKSITESCGSVEIVEPYVPPVYPVPQPYPQPVPQYPVSSTRYDLDVGCYADPSNAKLNQPITWVAEVVGGTAPYTYSWTGSDALMGTGRTAVKSYNTSGSKSAIVTVTSADGKVGSRACSNQVVIPSAYKPKPAPAKQVQAPVETITITASSATTTLKQTASLFSLAYVPWGWVALLVILVLFATVLYLLFNKQKI